MRVTDALPFDSYWKASRFQQKKANLRGSKKQAFGDNIYHTNPQTGAWLQDDSHHSYDKGLLNTDNLDVDTQVDRVLIGDDFAYWGANAPTIPARFFDFGTAHETIAARRNHRSKFSEDFLDRFIGWFRSMDQSGYLGDPLDWAKSA